MPTVQLCRKSPLPPAAGALPRDQHAAADNAEDTGDEDIDLGGLAGQKGHQRIIAVEHRDDHQAQQHRDREMRQEARDFFHVQPSPVSRISRISPESRPPFEGELTIR